MISTADIKGYEFHCKFLVNGKKASYIFSEQEQYKHGFWVSDDFDEDQFNWIKQTDIVSVKAVKKQD